MEGYYVCSFIHLHRDAICLIIDKLDYLSQVRLAATCKTIYDISNNFVSDHLSIDKCIKDGNYPAITKLLKYNPCLLLENKSKHLMNAAINGRYSIVKLMDSLGAFEIQNDDQAYSVYNQLFLRKLTPEKRACAHPLIYLCEMILRSKSATNWDKYQIINYLIFGESRDLIKFRFDDLNLLVIKDLNLLDLRRIRLNNFRNIISEILKIACRYGIIEVSYLIFEKCPQLQLINKSVLINACMGSSHELVDIFLQYPYEEIPDLNDLFNIAIEENNISVVNYLGQKLTSVDWIESLICSCSCGNVELFAQIFKFCPPQNIDWDELITIVCENGQYNLLFYIDSISNTLSILINWEKFLIFACKGNNENCVRFIIEKLPLENNCDFHKSFIKACKIGNFSIIMLLYKYLIGYMQKNNIQDTIIIDTAFEYACEYGCIEMVLSTMEHGACSWGEGLKQACLSGNIDIINIMIQKGADNFSEALTSACLSGHFNIIEIIIQKYKDVVDIDDAIIAACNSNNISLVNYLLQHKQSRQRSSRYGQALESICVANNIDLVKLIIDYCELSDIRFYAYFSYEKCHLDISRYLLKLLHIIQY